MIKIRWRCNLDDVMIFEKFPEVLAFRPLIGDLVRSKTKYQDYRIEFQVIRCTLIDTNEMEVELHLVPSRFENISSWTKWYRNVRGGI